MNIIAWHEVCDAIKVIETAITKVENVTGPEIVEWLLVTRIAGIRQTLSNAILPRWDAIQWWLQSHGFESDATEFEQRLKQILTTAGEWESQADYIACGRTEWLTKHRSGQYVELGELFGEDHEWTTELEADAKFTIEYLSRLRVTIAERTLSQRFQISNSRKSRYQLSRDADSGKIRALGGGWYACANEDSDIYIDPNKPIR